MCIYIIKCSSFFLYLLTTCSIKLCQLTSIAISIIGINYLFMSTTNIYIGFQCFLKYW